MGDVQANHVVHFLAEPEEAEVRAGLLLFHGGALAGPGLGVVLMGAGLAFFHLGSHVAGVVQHVGAPVAGVGPLLHFLGEVDQLVTLDVVVAQGVGIVLGHAVEQVHADALDVHVGGVRGLPAAGHLGAIGGAVAVGVPRNHVRLVVLDVLEVHSQVSPGMHAVFQAGFTGPVAAIHKAVVGPLRIVIFGHEVDLAVVLAQIPVLSGNLLPGLGGVGLEHVLGQGQESALLDVGPGVQPVGGGADQVDVAGLGGQGQVVLGGPVGPLDPADLQLGVDLFGQLLVDLGQHFLSAVGGDVAGHQVGDDDVLRGVDGAVGHGHHGQHGGEHHHGNQQSNQFLHDRCPPLFI